MSFLASPSIELQTERIMLDRMRHVARVAVSQEAVLRTHFDPSMFDTLVFELEARVLSEKLVGDTTEAVVTYQTPASWWQMFKATYATTWWLAWLVRRRPVRSKTHRATRSVTFERYATYPNATIKFPDLGKPVILERFVHD